MLREEAVILQSSAIGFGFIIRPTPLWPLGGCVAGKATERIYSLGYVLVWYGIKKVLTSPDVFIEP